MYNVVYFTWGCHYLGCPNCKHNWKDMLNRICSSVSHPCQNSYQLHSVSNKVWRRWWSRNLNNSLCSSQFPTIFYVFNSSSLDYPWYHPSFFAQLPNVVVFPCLICLEQMFVTLFGKLCCVPPIDNNFMCWA